MGVAYEKSIKLEGVKVRVVHQQNIKVAGPKDPAQRGLKITQLRRHIEVRGDFREQDVEDLLWGANHCPISNTLEGGVDLVTQIKVVE